MTKPRSKDFMETLWKKVEAEYELEKENLMKFFIQHNYSFEQSKELAYSLRRAVFYLKRDADKRKKWEIEFINYLRNKKKIDIKNIDLLLGLRKPLEEISVDNKIFLRATLIREFEMNRYKAIPRSGHQIVFFLALCEMFFKLKKYGLGQTAQVNIVYKLFVHFELDDYGTEDEDGEKYVGETEQKERIRKRFQQRAMKYHENFDKHLGWG